MGYKLVQALISKGLWKELSPEDKTVISTFAPEKDQEIITAIQEMEPEKALNSLYLYIDGGPEEKSIEADEKPREEKPKGGSFQSLRERFNRKEGLTPKTGENLKKFFSNKWVLIGGGVLVAVIVIVIAIGFFGKGSSSRAVTPTVSQPATSNLPGQSWWANLKNQPVLDRSPWGKGYLDANGFAAVIFVIFLVIWVILDWRARIKTHQGVGRFAIESLVLGFLLVPLINLTATWNLVWGFFVLVVMAFLVNAPIHSITAHKDKTHISTVFALLAFCLYVAGRFDLPVILGRLANTTWQSWQGVYGLDGLLVLAATLHFSSTILTMIIAILVFLAIWTGASEAGKRLGSGAYTLGIVMIILWIVSYWLMGRAENWLILQMKPNLTVTAALDIARPIISWLISTLVAFGLGLALGDQSLVVQERQIAFGLQGEKRSISSVVDFVSYATVIALAWMILS